MTLKKRKLTLQLIEERLNFLPLLPSVVCELINLDQDSDDFYEKMAKLTETDPPLAARVLAIANSASAAPTKPITNIQEALIRVGVGTIISLITTLSVAKIFVPNKPEHKAIWQHSIETAIFARFIASHMPSLQVDKHLAYTCGLLHDIGRFAMFEISAKSVEVIDSKGWNSPIELPQVEQHILGFTHAEVGYKAAVKWQLPKEVQNLIRYHHRYNISMIDKAPDSFKNLVILVQYADLLSVFVEKNPEWPSWKAELLGQEIPKYCQHKDWPALEFPLDAILKSLPDMASEVDEIMVSLRIH